MQVASALMARHIGGAVNYVGVAETLSMGPSAQTAGLAADNLVTALHFVVLFQLARHIGPDKASAEGGSGAQSPEQKKQRPTSPPRIGIQVSRSACPGCEQLYACIHDVAMSLD